MKIFGFFNTNNNLEFNDSLLNICQELHTFNKTKFFTVLYADDDGGNPLNKDEIQIVQNQINNYLILERRKKDE